MSGAAWHRATWLGRLPRSLADEALSLGRQVVFLPEETLMRQGDDGRHVILVVSGIAKVVATSAAGDVAVLSVRADGDLVGELASFDGQPRSASVVCCSAIQARVIPRAVFSDFVARHTAARDALEAMLADRLRWANRRRMDFVGCTPRIRLARVLLDLAAMMAPDLSAAADLVPIRLTQSDLASMAGVGLATAERSLRQLEDRGLLTRGYRSVSVVDVRGLEEFSNQPD